MKPPICPRLLPLLTLVLGLVQLPRAVISHDYSDALSKSILFFEGQRSGFLPEGQRMAWRGNSGLSDGWTHKMDLTGGYYDAGDNVKFHFPMSFTTTMLAWSVVDFGGYMPPSERQNALEAVKWSSDYLLKTVSQLPNRIFVQVGEPVADHNCWERPEDMDTPRTSYAIDAPNAASDLAGEIAAALAAASIAFKPSDPSYSNKLLQNAVTAFQYADSHHGSYSDNPGAREVVCPFYCSSSGYKDELLWGAAWLRRATGDESYLKYIESNREAFGAGYNVLEFGWDNKLGGINVLVAKEVLEDKMVRLQAYKTTADSFMCSFIPNSSGQHMTYTPAGLLHGGGMVPLQRPTSLSFLLLAYADYLSKASESLHCDSLVISPDDLRRIAKKQVDYILGDNPMKISYMMGYGGRFPEQIHHRGSSIPCVKAHPKPFGCKAGWELFKKPGPNPNVLTGAVVGGPDGDDKFVGGRNNATQSEPTTYTNAPFVGVLSYFAANPNFH
ncbi:PREDICTED: endoglucanase 23-like [Tarenaya hassleriana]|uniref:endoglucanase 23-like n=1 Tax=Tarenaya hassleriana TaxID=28532 RepID=UPI00053C401B|nr:PREDICTED: endoglucanase 23-like [Tarenaya hassleriana]